MPHNDAPRPNIQVAARVEELLREQLEERGVNPRTLSPEEIAANMHCHLAPNGSMTYLWKGEPMLHITPEKLVDENGAESVLWRMFTKDDMEPGDTAQDTPAADDMETALLDEDNEAGTYDSFLMDAADCACEDDDDDEPGSVPTAPLQ